MSKPSRNKKKEASAVKVTVYPDGATEITRVGPKDPPAMPERHASGNLPVGCRMPDGSIYAGVSPETGAPIFAMPEDAGTRLAFEEAAGYAARLRKEKALGHDDWRVPDLRELDVLFRARESGAFKGTFNKNAGRKDKWNPAGYWSSVSKAIYSGEQQEFGAGKQGWESRFAELNVRCIRTPAAGA